MKLLLEIAVLLGFCSVLLGAFGAHVLQRRVEPRRLESFRTAVQYQMTHALAMLGAVLLAAARLATPLALAAAWAFLAGILLFSGSLYLLTPKSPRALGLVTPVGGAAFLLGWVLLFAAVTGAAA